MGRGARGAKEARACRTFRPVLAAKPRRGTGRGCTTRHLPTPNADGTAGKPGGASHDLRNTAAACLSTAGTANAGAGQPKRDKTHENRRRG